MKERNANREANKSALYTRAHVLDEISAAARACPKKTWAEANFGAIEKQPRDVYCFPPECHCEDQEREKKGGRVLLCVSSSFLMRAQALTHPTQWVPSRRQKSVSIENLHVNAAADVLLACHRRSRCVCPTVAAAHVHKHTYTRTHAVVIPTLGYKEIKEERTSAFEY